MNTEYLHLFLFLNNDSEKKDLSHLSRMLLKHICLEMEARHRNTAKKTHIFKSYKSLKHCCCFYWLPVAVGMVNLDGFMSIQLHSEDYFQHNYLGLLYLFNYVLLSTSLKCFLGMLKYIDMENNWKVF